MKFFAVILAFVVATQASNIPGYSYWCSHNFCVYPTPSSYCYRLPFSQNWCSAQYYADCLREFPCPIPGSKNLCECEQDDITAFVQTIREKLEGKRCEIQEALEKKLPAFECMIQNLHARYLRTFRAYLAKCICKTSSTYAEKVQKYEEKLDELECEAIEKFNSDVEKIIERIECFHEQLLTKFQTCLETRKCRVDAYCTSLEEKSCDVQEKYAQCLTDHMTKRKQWVECIFAAIYEGEENIKTDTYGDAMEEYQRLLDCDKDWYIEDFRTKIEAAVTQLKDCYRCNYKCYFNTGCYGFNRRSFRQTIKSLPAPPQYNYKLIRVAVFKPEWKAPCPAPEPEDKEEEEETFDKCAYLDCIKTAYDKYLQDLSEKIDEWKCDVTEWKSAADSCLKTRIGTMEPKSRCGTPPSPADICRYQQKLTEKAETWLNNYECRFNGQIDSVNSKWCSIIESWKSKSDSYICKLESQFNCCMSSKSSKSTSYAAVLERKICQLRQQLNQRLQCMLTQHKQIFNSFYQCSFGCIDDDNIKLLKTDYIECVEAKVEAVLAEFDEFWCTEQEKYVTIYECKIKCLPKVSVPGLRTCWQWTFRKPSLSSFFRSYC
jgi:hypothetical protein